MRSSNPTRRRRRDPAGNPQQRRPSRQPSRPTPRRDRRSRHSGRRPRHHDASRRPAGEAHTRDPADRDSRRHRRRQDRRARRRRGSSHGARPRDPPHSMPSAIIGRPTAVAACDPRGSRPPRAADPSGLRGKNLPSARDERMNVSVVRVDGEDDVSIGQGGVVKRTCSHPHSVATSSDRPLDVCGGHCTETQERELKKLPTLRGRTVVNAFFENSTRTRISFEIAARSGSQPTSSTCRARARASQRARACRTRAQTLSAMGVDAIVSAMGHREPLR